MKRMIFTLLLLLSWYGQAVAGYAIVTAPQQEEYSTVNGPYGPRTWKNTEKPQVVGVGQVEVCRSNPWNVFSPDPASRTIVYSDAAGTATSADLLAACPGIRIKKEKEIRAEGDRRLAALAAPYEPHERETWAVQMKEAEEWKANNAAFVPMIAGIAKGRGITIAELVAKILGNVSLFRAASGDILGQQQFLLDWIERETDFATLINITWE